MTKKQRIAELEEKLAQAEARANHFMQSAQRSNLKVDGFRKQLDIRIERAVKLADEQAKHGDYIGARTHQVQAEAFRSVRKYFL